MRKASFFIAAAVVCSLGINSLALGAGEIVGASRRTNLDASTDRIEFFLRNAQQGNFAGSSNIAAAELTLASNKPMVIENPMPSATQSGLRTVTEVTTVDSTIFGTGFYSPGQFSPTAFQFVGFDIAAPYGVAAVTANSGRGAGVISVIVEKDATVTMSGLAGNEFFLAGSGSLEAGTQYAFAPVIAAVPEPTSLVLLSLGAAAALRRRAR